MYEYMSIMSTFSKQKYDYAKPKHGKKVTLCYMDVWFHWIHKNRWYL